MRLVRLGKTRFQLLASASAALVAWSVSARAQNAEPTPDDIKRAARAFDIARTAYSAEDYETAADQFETADGHAPSPVALQWAIDSHHQAGHAARAATLAALARQRHPDVTELIEVADQVIADTESELVEVQIACDQPCELFVDNKIVHGRRATARTLYLDPGEYTLKASFGPGRLSKAETVTGQADDTVSVLFSLPGLGNLDSEEESLEGMEDPFADEPATDDPFADSSSRQPKVAQSGGWTPAVFWVGASLTAVGGAVTTWSGLDTQANPGRDVVRAECRGEGTDCDAYQDGLRRQKRTNILLGVTGGLAAFTVVAAILTDWSSTEPAPEEGHERRSPRRAAWSVEPWMSIGDGAQLGATGRF